MGLGNQFATNPKRFLLGIIGALAVVALIIAGYYWHRPNIDTFSLSKEVKNEYTEALLLSYREKKPEEAIEKLDAEISGLNKIAVKSETDLYMQAKLEIYKGDLLIGMRKLSEGFKLLSRVYANSEYDDSVRSEALLLALARAVQGLGESSLDENQIQQFVLYDSALGRIATTSLLSSVPTPLRIYDSLLAGFSKIAANTTSPKVALLAQSYRLRLYAQIIGFTEDSREGYGLLASDIEQLESDLNLLSTQLQAPQAVFEEFFVTSLYNLALAHEFLPKEDESARINAISRMREKIITYESHFPDEAYRVRPFEDALGARLVCRLVNKSGYQTGAVDKIALKGLLDPLIQTAASDGGFAIPCIEQFTFVARNIDTRFAPYVNK